MKSRGLGDSLEKFMRTTGIKNIIKTSTKLVGKKDCGCSERKEILNERFPYKK